MNQNREKENAMEEGEKWDLKNCAIDVALVALYV